MRPRARAAGGRPAEQIKRVADELRPKMSTQEKANLDSIVAKTLAKLEERER